MPIDYLYQKGLEKGQAEGDAQGRAGKTHEAAVNMLKKGYEVAAICEILEVSEAFVLEVKKEMGL